MTLDLKMYQSKLLSRLAFLTGRVSEIEDKFQKSSDAPFDNDPAAITSLGVLDDMDDMAASEAKAIHAALKRLEDGTFGVCVTCGDPIDTDRLNAVPHTPFCKEHAR